MSPWKEKDFFYFCHSGEGRRRGQFHTKEQSLSMRYYSSDGSIEIMHKTIAGASGW